MHEPGRYREIGGPVFAVVPIGEEHEPAERHEHRADGEHHKAGGDEVGALAGPTPGTGDRLCERDDPDALDEHAKRPDHSEMAERDQALVVGQGRRYPEAQKGEHGRNRDDAPAPVHLQ